jgi:hypothetical protein
MTSEKRIKNVREELQSQVDRCRKSMFETVNGESEQKLLARFAYSLGNLAEQVLEDDTDAFDQTLLRNIALAIVILETRPASW